ncbi:hypothetical protein C5O22_04160 [Treponema sp. J25]|nr:hypothetical protein C5O22_04160 [Treponema sp. J25]
MKYIITFVIAYIVSRLFWGVIGFSYLLFEAPFNFWKLLVDVGTFCGIYFFVWNVIRIVEKNQNIIKNKEFENE